MSMFGNAGHGSFPKGQGSYVFLLLVYKGVECILPNNEQIERR